jgi:hypothetical protein
VTKRDANGRFIKGETGNPNGRPRKRTEEQYLHATINNVTLIDWAEIVNRAVHDAKLGDTAARKFLAEYLLGKPEQVLKHDGAGGFNLLVEYVNDWRTAQD